MRKLLIAVLLISVTVPLGLWLAGTLAPRPTVDFLLGLERSAAGLKERSTSIPGFEIRYLEGGVGEPLLLLHGFGANKDTWTRVARRLTPYFRVIAPDLPGFGDSSKPSGAGYRYADQLPRLKAFMDTLGVEHFHVGGSSMGGYFAAGLAVHYPEAVRSAWLLAPGGVHSAQPSEMMQRIANGEPVPLLARTVEDFDRILGFVMSDPPWIPGFYRTVLAERAVAAYPLNARIFEQIRFQSPALEDEVAGLDTPVLIHWGEQDRVLHVSGAAVLEGVLPNARVIRLPGIGHLPMLEAEARVARDYIEFRDRLQGDAR